MNNWNWYFEKILHNFLDQSREIYEISIIRLARFGCYFFAMKGKLCLLVDISDSQNRVRVRRLGNIKLRVAIIVFFFGLFWLLFFSQTCLSCLMVNTYWFITCKIYAHHGLYWMIAIIVSRSVVSTHLKRFGRHPLSPLFLGFILGSFQSVLRDPNWCIVFLFFFFFNLILGNEVANRATSPFLFLVHSDHCCWCICYFKIVYVTIVLF
jgi:hypothetical protein